MSRDRTGSLNGLGTSDMIAPSAPPLSMRLSVEALVVSCCTRLSPNFHALAAASCLDTRRTIVTDVLDTDVLDSDFISCLYLRIIIIVINIIIVVVIITEFVKHQLVWLVIILVTALDSRSALDLGFRSHPLNVEYTAIGKPLTHNVPLPESPLTSIS